MILQYIFQLNCASIACSGNLCYGTAVIIHGTDNANMIIGYAFFMVFSTAFVGLSGHDKIILFGMVSFEADRDISFIDHHITLQPNLVVE